MLADRYISKQIRTILLKQVVFSISDRPSFLAGHFPGHPVIPAVVLLNELLEGVVAIYPDQRIHGFKQVKFHKPVLPGEKIRVDLKAIKMGVIGFQAHRSNALVFSGEMSCEAVE